MNKPAFINRLATALRRANHSYIYFGKALVFQTENPSSPRIIVDVPEKETGYINVTAFFLSNRRVIAMELFCNSP